MSVASISGLGKGPNSPVELFLTLYSVERLPTYNIELPTQARPILQYMDEVFARPSFQESLTELEQEMRQ